MSFHPWRHPYPRISDEKSEVKRRVQGPPESRSAAETGLFSWCQSADPLPTTSRCPTLAPAPSSVWDSALVASGNQSFELDVTQVQGKGSKPGDSLPWPSVFCLKSSRQERQASGSSVNRRKPSSAAALAPDTRSSPAQGVHFQTRMPPY